ncbi:nuclear transport factor 2 family protein [Sphingomonas jatrophae]|uniref:EthD domain-containing protein n=1 Tax=Sphingomonas jatrophae TaxID=1166337 RepID=A0A1I6KK89_9SPHN|nr:nuclear transport factor 2 family protein [Sphingomonas jatrophae]SFR91611.1 EthD domain-containing protein [Sphingomonas jatrophae]
MLKCIALLKRKPGLSDEALVAYYEGRHAPLIVGLCPQILAYRRNFVQAEGRFEFGAAIDFDVVTELYFADRTAYDAFVARNAEPEVARLIAEDEENVFDRAATRMMVVEEHGGAIPGRPVPAADGLRALQDERAIQRGLARFARVLDGKDWGSLGDVFAADLDFDYGQGERQGMAALEDQMRRYLDACGGTQHLLGSILVDVDGDSAVSRAYVQARHQRRGEGGGAIFDSNGEYVDRWARRADGWRIVRRDATWATHSGDPAILAAGADELG